VTAGNLMIVLSFHSLKIHGELRVGTIFKDRPRLSDTLYQDSLTKREFD